MTSLEFCRVLARSGFFLFANFMRRLSLPSCSRGASRGIRSEPGSYPSIRRRCTREAFKQNTRDAECSNVAGFKPTGTASAVSRTCRGSNRFELNETLFFFPSSLFRHQLSSKAMKFKDRRKPANGKPRDAESRDKGRRDRATRRGSKRTHPRGLEFCWRGITIAKQFRNWHGIKRSRRRTSSSLSHTRLVRTNETSRVKRRQ